MLQPRMPVRQNCLDELGVRSERSSFELEKDGKRQDKHNTRFHFRLSFLNLSFFYHMLRLVATSVTSEPFSCHQILRRPRTAPTWSPPISVSDLHGIWCSCLPAFIRRCLQCLLLVGPSHTAWSLPIILPVLRPNRNSAHCLLVLPTDYDNSTDGIDWQKKNTVGVSSEPRAAHSAHVS
jgi:hypothetical protein